MPAALITVLQPQLRALREVQAPQQISAAADRTNGYRVSSAAFKPGRDGTVSVDLEESLLRAGLTATGRYPAMDRAVALVAHRIQAVVDQGMTVAHAPIEGNEHHAEIRMGALSRKAIERAARALADACEFLEQFNVAEIERISAAAKPGAAA